MQACDVLESAISALREQSSYLHSAIDEMDIRIEQLEHDLRLLREVGACPDDI